MFKKDNLEVPSDKVNTIIGKATLFNGTISGKGLIRIDGEAEGTIVNQGDVVVGEGGRVSIELKARNITIAGYFEGSLEAEGKLELKSTGNAVGTFKANALVVEEGAVLAGTMEMAPKQKTGADQPRKEKAYGPLGTDSPDKSNKQKPVGEGVSREKAL